MFANSFTTELGIFCDISIDVQAGYIFSPFRKKQNNFNSTMRR